MKLSESIKDSIAYFVCLLSFWIMAVLLVAGGLYLLGDNMHKANQEKVVYSQPLP